MTKHLLTPSLINSFQYYIQDEWKSPEDSRADFLKTLSREKAPTTEAQAKGIKFENDIFDCCNGKYLKFRPVDTFPAIEPNTGEVLEIADNYDFVVNSLSKIVKGGLWQQSVKKDLKVGNHDFLLYGRTDVIKRDTVFDIKFTSNYELGKFQDSSQHLIYLYCSDLPKFSYLVSDGKDWWREDYFNHAGIEGEIKSKVSEFLNYVEGDKEAKELYFNNWTSKRS